MRAVILLALALTAVSAAPSSDLQRIVGGSVTTIDNYPTIAALLHTNNWSTYTQQCGGSILNNRSFLTAAHCIVNDAVGRWRVRVGSTWANSGGVIHQITNHILHPSYNQNTFDNDIAIMRSSSVISFNNNVQPASIAGANYNLADNQVVWAAGWGALYMGGPLSEQLRHVQVWTVNQAVCRTRYGANSITDNMLCAGWLDIGGRDACTCDSGGPLYHNRVLVGVTSWGSDCGSAFHPGVYARVTRYVAWIQSNA